VNEYEPRTEIGRKLVEIWSHRRPTLPEVVPAFAAYYRKVGEAWGGLHIVLSDGNHADGHVRYVIEAREAEGDEEAATLARVLLTLTKTQRGKLDRLVRAHCQPNGGTDGA
jgi:hypothetical protein